ncbi:hypothetical protein [Mangrovivirga cuniculi]|uniref:Viral A-type inclusion protein n=1 Tax=Mangrovivirga cuniculi TaxID=2715131 RepID=A0A4D7JFR5_9BACT|nr:hypothetical protein [Mangrovivirga cuniculi]QCK13953.1 hypothetical protein DCC35_03885 [Mangrovivirga cuniculi]
MKYLIYSLSFICLLSLGSCGDNQESEEDLSSKRDSLYNVVMHEHDELMNPATTLNKMRSNVEKQLDSISVAGDTVNNVYYTNLKKAHLEILTAQNEMRAWMMNFKRKGVAKDKVTEYDAMVDTMAIEYLEGEYIKLQELRKTTEKALQADSLAN